MIARTFRSSRARFVLAVAGLGLAGSLLAGCAGASPELDSGAAATLQDGVLAVSSAAAAGDFATAQTELGTVQTALADASAADAVTAARAAEIQAAIDLVGADLAASIVASTPVPTSTPEPVSTDDDDDNDDNDNDDDPAPAKPEKPAKDTGDCKKKDKCD
ncbi:hypothetical protein E3T61_17225 [Cryobacterium lactosi]|uniref:Mucin-associated surface protein n=1 Tax=Cryobacterium lactosi TaxID=1259202 RepID=A0A4R9BJD3_9MICO|nr:hypothetical protein [Cryobacterium lactosi]TFD85865.1 hypothetical protein E3T61_17225 [Cryobacterium lactosi]